MSYKSMAAEDPLVPDDGKPFEFHARRIYRKHFKQEPPRNLVEHWKTCQEAAKERKARP